MKVVIDNHILVHLMKDPKGAALTDPSTGNVIDRIPERAASLLEYINVERGRLYIPAPVLTEYLIGIARKNQHTHLNDMNNLSCVQIMPFDEMAAYECAQMVDDQELKAIESDASATKAKLRVDRQVLAIALAVGADELWTHDHNLMSKSNSLGMRVKSLADILPPRQGGLFPV